MLALFLGISNKVWHIYTLGQCSQSPIKHVWEDGWPPRALAFTHTLACEEWGGINQTKPSSCFFHPSHNKQRTHQLAVRFNTRFFFFFLIGAYEWQQRLVFPLTAVPIHFRAGLHSAACKTGHISPCILREEPLSTKVWKASWLLALEVAARDAALPARLCILLLSQCYFYCTLCTMKPLALNVIVKKNMYENGWGEKLFKRDIWKTVGSNLLQFDETQRGMRRVH